MSNHGQSEASINNLPNCMIIHVAHRIQNFRVGNEDYQAGYTEIKDMDSDDYNKSFVNLLLNNGYVVDDLKVSSSGTDSGMYVIEIYRLRRHPMG